MTCLHVSDGQGEGRSELILTDSIDVSSKSLLAFPLLKFNPSNFGRLMEGVVVFFGVAYLSSLTRGENAD